MIKALRLFALLLTLSFVPSHLNASVILGQIETFDDPHNWIIGVGPVSGSPSPVPTAMGGPAGATDPYLSIIATGGAGPRSRLSAQNFVEWSGDYLAAGVSAIRMDVRNFGSTDLFLRLLFVEFDALNAPVSAAFSMDSIFVPGGSDWQTINFDVSPSALSPISGLPTVDPAATLSNTVELRIFHNPAPFFIPTLNPAVVAHLGVDNITAADAAAAVPEPATGGLLLMGVVLARLGRKRVSAP